MADTGKNVEDNKQFLSLIRRNEEGEEIRTDDSTFEDYIDKTEAYVNIIEEMMSRFEEGATSSGDLIENGKWVSVSEEKRQTGLMSICPTLSAMLSMDVDMLEQSIFDGNVRPKSQRAYCCNKYRARILAMLQFIINHISVKKMNKKSYVYDLSPFIVQNDLNIEFKNKMKPEVYGFRSDTSFIGSICWVGEVMVKTYTLATTKDEAGKPLLRLRSLSQEELWSDNLELAPFENEEAEEQEHLKQLDVIKEIIKDCIDKIADYTILKKSGRDDELKAAGWSYTKPADGKDLDMSLYFTYRVADFWLILFKCLGKEYYIFRDFEQLFETDEMKGKMICPDKYWSKEQFVGVLNQVREKIGGQERGKKRTKKALVNDLEKRYKEVSKDYEKINFLFKLNGDNKITNVAGNFAKYKKYLLDVARDIWDVYGNDMDDSFFYSDLTKVPEAAIGKGGMTDILFNTLFMQGIMISGALDVELEKEDRENGPDSNLYKTFLDTMEATLQKILDKYTTMKRDGEQYKVDRYYIRMDSDKSKDPLVSKIRKANIMGHVLVPLLTKVNNLLPRKKTNLFLRYRSP